MSNHEDVLLHYCMILSKLKFKVALQFSVKLLVQVYGLMKGNKKIYKSLWESFKRRSKIS